MSHPPLAQMGEHPGLARHRQFAGRFAVHPQAVEARRPRQVDQIDFEEFAGKVVLCGECVMRFGTWHDPFLLDNRFPPK